MCIMFPTGMFETTTQRKVLRVLAEKNKRYTIEELADMCHRSEATISRSLKNVNRYPFIERGRVPGSKQLTFRLDPDSRYTSAVRELFRAERDRERHNATIPVDVWNLLEDVTQALSDKLDHFLELFLFGSYATGEYYSGSDIDLLLVHTGDKETEEDAYKLLRESIGDERLQMVTVQLKEGTVERKDGEILERTRERAPVRDVDVLVPLSGEVST